MEDTEAERIDEVDQGQGSKHQNDDTRGCLVDVQSGGGVPSSPCEQEGGEVEDDEHGNDTSNDVPLFDLGVGYGPSLGNQQQEEGQQHL